MLAMLVTFAAMMVQAQGIKITGKIVDSETKEAVMQSTVQLLRSDSTFVSGALTDEKGEFAIESPGNGKFILKVSNIGYAILTKAITVSQDKELALGTLSITPDAIMLEGVTATGQAKKVVIKEET